MFPSIKMFFSILSCESLEMVSARKVVMDLAQAEVGAP
jgi:hypothetical protein